MATKIFVDQENGDLASILSKDQLKRSKSVYLPPANEAKPLLKHHSGKVFSSSGIMEKTARKALGNINKQTNSLKPVPAKKVTKPVPVTKRTSDAPVKPTKQSYPEIEKIFPYNPEDFETFDVPEEHKLSHLCLAGVPLIVNATEFYRSPCHELMPMDIPVFSWQTDVCDSALFLKSLDKMSLGLPPMIS